jgi:hypothetical protein
LTPVVQMIWPTVNERPSAMAAKSGMMTILLTWEVVRTPPTWRATTDDIWSAVYRGICRQCRRDMVDSLPRGMPKVVDCR